MVRIDLGRRLDVCSRRFESALHRLNQAYASTRVREKGLGSLRKNYDKLQLLRPIDILLILFQHKICYTKMDFTITASLSLDRITVRLAPDEFSRFRF